MRLEKYFSNIQQDLKIFFFILMVLCLYRAEFMWQMSHYMGDNATGSEIGLALWTGLRLSLKTAGAVTLFPFVFCTVVNIFLPRLNTARVRLIWGSIVLFALAILFQGRFPYYQEYGMTYGLQVVLGMNDDRQAIVSMMIAQYGLLWRAALAILLTLITAGMLHCLLQTKTAELPHFLSGKNIWGERSIGRSVALSILFLAVTFVFGLFVRFGGSFNYDRGVDWENAGVTADHFLNECILDDCQALYRAKSIAKELACGEVKGIEKDKAEEWAAFLTGKKLNGGDALSYLWTEAAGNKLPKPRHIFIILGESLAQWPITDEYAELGAADGLRALIKEPDCYYSRAFMSNGDFTAVSMTGIISGLSLMGISVQYQPQSFMEPYPCALAPQFKGLGYAVDFWYGGMPSWDSIDRFAIAQGVDHYYGYPDYHAPKHNAWGTTDKELFAALLAHLASEPPTVHVVMTVSNHPPYDLDVEAEGFDLARAKQLTKKLKVNDPDVLALELGHYRYSDKAITEFIRQARKMYPDSLFIVTGDHAVRTNPSVRPTLFEQYSVPFILYGAGVTKSVLPKDAPGGHTSIGPTLVELIAPKGYRYCSIGQSMTRGLSAGVGGACWITSRSIGLVNGSRTELLPGTDMADIEEDKAAAEQMTTALRTVSWWITERAKNLK